MLSLSTLSNVYPLGRQGSYSFAEKVLLTASTISVAGIALTLFTSSAFALMFSLIGAACAFGAYFISINPPLIETKEALDAEVTRLKNQLDTLETNLTQLNTEVSRLEGENSRLEKNIEQVQNFRARLDESTSRLNEVRLEIEATSRELHGLQAVKAELSEQVVQLRSEVGSLAEIRTRIQEILDRVK